MIALYSESGSLFDQHSRLCKVRLIERKTPKEVRRRLDSDLFERSALNHKSGPGGKRHSCRAEIKRVPFRELFERLKQTQPKGQIKNNMRSLNLE